MDKQEIRDKVKSHLAKLSKDVMHDKKTGDESVEQKVEFDKIIEQLVEWYVEHRERNTHMKKCPNCGRKLFYMTARENVLFKCDDSGSLLQQSTEQMSVSGDVICVNCGNAYSSKEFGRIITE